VPTYQYRCTECGGELEAVQKFSDEPLTVHEDCGGRLRKVFSPVGIVFKGSGFYRTDSRKGSTASEPATASSSASSSSDSSSSSSNGGDKAASSDKSSSSSSSEKSSSSAPAATSKSSAEKVA
jgi:putative FmdB family regulatory protein